MSEGSSATAGTPARTGASVVLEHLRLEGVDTIFGIPGSANAHLLLALGGPEGEGIRYVICRQETGAAYAADGYARVSGGLGVVLVTAGPGALNAVAGAVNANESRTPMLVLTGEVAQQWYGRSYLQEGVDAGLDVADVYQAAVDSSRLASTATNLPQLLRNALRHALADRGAAAHLSLPDDLMAAPADDAPMPSTPAAYRATRVGVDTDAIDTIAHALADADFPLLYLGDGCRAALRDPERRARFDAAVTRVGLPVLCSPDGKAIFPETHRLSLRNYGMGQSRWPNSYLLPSTIDAELPDHFDALAVFGCRLGELATITPSTDPKNVHWSHDLQPVTADGKPGFFAHVDNDPAVIGRDYPITLGVVADLAAGIDALCAALEAIDVPTSKDRRLALVDRIEAEVEPFRDAAMRTSTERPLAPQALLRLLSEHVSAGARPADVWVDAGNCVGWSLHHLVVDPPNAVHSALTMGPMGFAVGAVVGGCMADDNRRGIAVVGDGAFLMHAGEVSTAAAHGVGATWIVLDDGALNMVVQGMETMFPGKGDWARDYALGTPDLGKVAEGLGATAHVVDSASGAASALAAASDGAADGVPQVIVARIDASQIPPYYPEKKT